MTKVIKTYRGYEIKVDDNDYEWLKKYTWCVGDYTHGYATCTDRSDGKQKSLRIHRLITNAKPGEFVDHINHDRLDNRRSNLRVCTPAQNSYNARKRKDGASKYKGVYKYGEKYCSSIQYDFMRYHLGYYTSEEDAAYYYNLKAKEYYGDFAALNELPSNYIPNEPFKPNLARGIYSKYRGVTWCKKDKRWKAKIQHKGRTINIGSFITERIAAEMYNTFAAELHGEKAKFNVFKEAF